MPKVNCSVCSSAMQGDYCSDCGQRYTGRRISQSTVLRDVLDNLYGLDRSLWSNIVLAVKDPQFLVQNFWTGYRRYHFGPGKFMVIAALALVLNFVVTQESYLLIKIESHEVGQQFAFLFITLVLFAFSSYLTYYWPWRKNLAEHVVLNLYTVGLWTIIFTPFSIIGGLLPDPAAEIINNAAFLLYVALILIWNTRVFPIQSWAQRLGRILLQALLMAAMFWGMTFL